MQKDIVKKLIQIQETLSYRHSQWKVFSDCLSLLALGLRFLSSPDEETQENLKMILDSYTEAEITQIELLSETLETGVQENRKNGFYQDILGEWFHSCDFQNEWVGQFFTPYHIAELCSAMSLGDVKGPIQKKGYFTICEPACGSGVMLLSAAGIVARNDFEPEKAMLCQATDIDIRCVHMAYIQLSLYQIPAFIFHGNTLTGELWSTWKTPAVLTPLWQKRMEQVSPATTEDSTIQSNECWQVVCEQLSLF